MRIDSDALLQRNSFNFFRDARGGPISQRALTEIVTEPAVGKAKKDWRQITPPFELAVLRTETAP
jgi:hypothetical protein